MSQQTYVLKTLNGEKVKLTLGI